MVAFFVFMTTRSIATILFTNKVDRANEALKIYDYFKAKKLFTESLKKHPIESNFGLAVIYSRKDNPFSNLDSALYRIKLCEDALYLIDKTKSKNIEIEKEYSQKAESLFVRIDNELFFIAQNDNSLESYKRYQSYFTPKRYFKEISRHYYKTKLNAGSILFSEALRLKQSNALQALNQKCDSSFCELTDEIKTKLPNLIIDLQFAETASKQSISAYLQFRQNHPNSIYEQAIDDSIFSISTKTKTEKSYYDFIKLNPKNKNVNKAWQLIYNSASNDNSPNFFKHFLEKYPEYPFIENVAKEYKLSQTTFYKIRHNKLFGFCDENGNELIKPAYEYVDEFSEGYCVVSANGKSGYINRNGSLAMPCVYDEAEKFSDGLAVVKKEEQYLIINKKFEVVYTSSNEINDFSEGLSVCKIGDKYGFINTLGRLEIEAQFENAYDFRNGFAVVEKSGKVGLINHQGQAVVPFEYEWIDPFSKLLYRVQTEDKIRLFNVELNNFIQDDYDFIDALNDGLAAVHKDEKLGYIDSLGNFIIQPQFEINEEAKPQQQFENGFALVSVKGKNIVIDKSGKKVLNSSYQSMKKPSENMVAVKKKNKWGYVDIFNEQKIKFQYQEATRFTDGLAIVKLKNKQFIIDVKGNIKQKIKQERYEFLGNRLLIIETQNKRGLYDINFQLLVSDINEIKPFRDNLYIIEKGGKTSYFNILDKKFLWKEDGFNLN
jgi:hypothetical protein